MRAFVVMPFDPEFTAVYERLIEPALSDLLLNVQSRKNRK